MSDYDDALAAIDAGGIEYSWSRTGNGGHTITTYGAWGIRSHVHYRRDGSVYPLKACGCWL